MAAKDASTASARTECSKAVMLDMELHFRHATSLMLRNVKRHVTHKLLMNRY